MLTSIFGSIGCPRWGRPTALAAMATMLVLAGCHTVEQRPGLTARDGAYEQFVAASPDRVIDAARQTLAGMTGLMPVSAGMTPDGVYQVVDRNQQDTQVIIEVQPTDAAGTASRYTVRIEPGEGEGLATAIIDGINGRLGTSRMTPTVTPATSRPDGVH